MPAIGDAIYGGYFAGWMDTTTGNIIAADASQTGVRYMLIVAPTSLRPSASFKTTDTAAPAASRTMWDGLAATQSMTGTTYPAADYCNGLSYPGDGGSQWYLPAMDELELIYRNLKPTTTANYVATRAAGTFPGIASSMGVDASCDPAGAAYTTGAPAQTSVALFRSGGAQALDVGDGHYWSSTEYDATYGWKQVTAGTYAGYQVNDNKTSVKHVLPVRRIANVAPNAPTLNTPATGDTVNRGVTNRLGFTPSDPNVGDSQSKFDLQYKIVGAGSWTTITQTTPNNYWDATGGTFAAGSYEWQVRTYDALGLVGPYSASSFFTAADAASVPTITAPTNGSTITLSTATVTWSAPNQTDYQLRKMDDVAGTAGTTVYYDSGDVVDATTRSVTVAFATNNRWEHIQVRIKLGGLWSTWADCRVDVSFTEPMVPTLTATASIATASIAVVITNPAPTGGEPAVAYNDVLVSSPLDPEYRAATLVTPNGTWTWRTPAAGRVYTVRVEAVGSNGTRTTST